MTDSHEPRTEPRVLPSFIDREWLDAMHPTAYTLPPDPTMTEADRAKWAALTGGKSADTFNRCPTCEEWSPCRVRTLFEVCEARAGARSTPSALRAALEAVVARHTENGLIGLLDPVMEQARAALATADTAAGIDREPTFTLPVSQVKAFCRDHFPGDLDAAWAAAEAAAPRRVIAIGPNETGYWAEARPGFAIGFGPTPAAALRALAERLAATP